MRVTVLCEYGTLMGGERSLLAMMDQLAGPGIQFTVVAPAEGRFAAELQQRRIRHVPLDLHDDLGQRLPRETATASLVETVRGTQPDLLHANSLSIGRFSGAIGEQLGIPASAHLRDILRLSAQAIKDLNRNDRLLAVSQATLDFHVGQGMDRQRVEVAWNGVDLSEFQPGPSTGRLKCELDVPPSAFLIATIGQICLRKGHDMLAAAARGLTDLDREVHFLIVGERYSSKAESVEFEARIADDFAAVGLASRLHLMGYRDDVPWILNEVDALVHPARQEPLGRVLLEAAASGTPIIATDVGGTREILEDGRSGLLVAADDPEALVRAVRRVADDAQLRQRLGSSARETAVTKFDVSQRAEAVAQIWRRMVQPIQDNRQAGA